MNDIMILLPERVFVLRDKRKQDIKNDREEFSIYFRNIIYPYSEEYDIQIECGYGRNLGNCWRIDSFDDNISEFDLVIRIFGTYGRLLTDKVCRIEILEKEQHKEVNLLCIGDSMTRGEVYIQQAAEKSRGVNTVGLRNIKYSVSHEGRGGWKSYDYFREFEDGGMGVSPFLFPKECRGGEYFGSRLYWDRVSDKEFNTKYQYTGIKPQTIKDGMICYADGALYRYKGGEYHRLDILPHFEFDFGKYIERYDIARPDIVSLLFGANEFQTCGYEGLKEELKKYIEALKMMIRSIKEYDRNIKIIINMPICGGSQYAWGIQMGCQGTAKQYDYCIKRAGEALLAEFDDRLDENIFVCPMLAVCDTEAGFLQSAEKANMYSELLGMKCVSWVHPSDVGYRQMGDALAAVITAARKTIM